MYPIIVERGKILLCQYSCWLDNEDKAEIVMFLMQELYLNDSVILRQPHLAYSFFDHFNELLIKSSIKKTIMIGMLEKFIECGKRIDDKAAIFYFNKLFEKYGDLLNNENGTSLKQYYIKMICENYKGLCGHHRTFLFNLILLINTYTSILELDFKQQLIGNVIQEIHRKKFFDLFVLCDYSWVEFFKFMFDHKDLLITKFNSYYFDTINNILNMMVVYYKTHRISEVFNKYLLSFLIEHGSKILQKIAFHYLYSNLIVFNSIVDAYLARTDCIHLRPEFQAYCKWIPRKHRS